MTLQVWIDDQIADRAAFAQFGGVHTFPGRSITSNQLKTADALIVRSVTRVDRALLEGTSIRFVGTVTTGLDHVDVTWLNDNGIAFATAAGFNSRPVAEYVLTCIFLIAGDRRCRPESMTLGVVGAGRIGSLIGHWAAALGMRVLYSDPPRASVGDPGPWTPIDALLAESDVVSLHVPLTTDGSHPTSGMVGDRWLSRMKTRATLINTSRGGIVDEYAMKSALQSESGPDAIIDTWLHEPGIDGDLMAMCRIATPHIAGHSVNARHRGAQMICEALNAWRNRTLGDRQILPPASDGDIHIAEASPMAQSIVAAAGQPRLEPSELIKIESMARKECPLVEMDRVFRSAMANGGSGFDAARRQLGGRREFTHQVDCLA
ncbi:MAG: 4-phosphoerythronate dehydrogenase [Phycisphaerales bacterium]|nr:4-phosphoerythronate dehydrogenase [Phycisphaerales bacterium]MCB9855684.1 4-phosphoerythronate dehydrogenase [Phycisphaerales bacterium]MCB9862579.1 4-phosphoerythronate dehydrogenase [Phycisphaerales bacterium]